MTLPEDPSLDSTLSLLRDGYTFISRRCARHDSDAFRCRIMLTNVICMRGSSAARLFYGHANLTRVGSMPAPVLRLLQDKGSVQQLDAEAHIHRKAMFVHMLMRRPAGETGKFGHCVWPQHVAQQEKDPAAVSGNLKNRSSDKALVRVGPVEVVNRKQGSVGASDRARVAQIRPPAIPSYDHRIRP